MKHGEYKKHKGVVPGGIKCPCCSPGGYGIAAAKQWLNKAVMRHGKRVIKQELENA